MAQKVVVRKSLSDQATILIKENVFSMKYLPGQRLVVDKLAEELQVSRTPVRDGLSSLVEQGLVEYNGTGYTVFKPTAGGVSDLFEIRAVLESLSVKQAVKKMATEEIQALRQVFHDSEALIADHSLSELIDLDIFFHDTIMIGSQNARLQKLLQTVREQCWLIRRWGFGKKEVIIEQAAIDEHIGILDAMLVHDGKTAAALMHDHLINSELRLLKLPNIQRLFEQEE